MARGAVLGARGNSGMMLAHFLWALPTRSGSLDGQRRRHCRGYPRRIRPPLRLPRRPPGRNHSHRRA
jgi:hypothetical protein